MDWYILVYKEPVTYLYLWSERRSAVEMHLFFKAGTWLQADRIARKFLSKGRVEHDYGSYQMIAKREYLLLAKADGDFGQRRRIVRAEKTRVINGRGHIKECSEVTVGCIGVRLEMLPVTVVSHYKRVKKIEE